MPFLEYDSKPEEVSATVLMEYVEVNMPKALDIEGLICLLNKLNDEATDLSKKIMVGILPGVYPGD